MNSGQRPQKILLVKMSSLGDVVHNLPAATDIRRYRPDTIIDWVVEEQYVPLVSMHPAVNRVIPVALRRWRRSPLSVANWREFGALRKALREHAYDAIVDTQGLLKSALVAKLARGPIIGFGPGTVREPIASRLYDTTIEFPPQGHKVSLYRSFVAQALGYAVAAGIDYGIAPRVPVPRIATGRYYLAFHATARAEKLWQEANWVALLRRLEKAGYACILPWGSDEEHARSERIAASSSTAIIPSRLSLDDMAALISGADFVVGVDTGLMHLAAALTRPVVGIYCNSDPVDVGPVGPGPTVHRGHIGAPPTVDDVADAIGEVARISI
ncbi:MAG TPA: lipopolysaccharide heptosyltransferase I [Burkholderiales bacterium]|jgi:heptosyltransferase-1|nr:lipopolysaccharide heptosyltransferase I [Burkholderiales bacterium]